MHRNASILRIDMLTLKKIHYSTVPNCPEKELRKEKIYMLKSNNKKMARK